MTADQPAPGQAVWLGQMVFVWSGDLEGWCYAPSREGERAVVEITANGALVATVTAAKFRPSLHAAGLGDGRYGFVLKLPPATVRPTAFVMIEAREQQTGLPFARIVRRGGPQDIPAEQRINQMERVLDACFARLDQFAPPQAVAEGLGGLGRAVMAAAPRGGTPGCIGIAMGHQALAAVPRTDLGFHPDPAVSIVLPAAPHWPATVTALRDLAAGLRGVAAEFILLDTGADPLTALLPTRLRHLTVIRHRGPATHPAALNAAALACRGRRLLFVADSERPDGCCLAAALAGPADQMLLGPGLREAGPIDTVQTNAVRTGLQLCITREAFHAIGGLDESEADPWPGFLERARMLGLRSVAWQEPARLRRA